GHKLCWEIIQNNRIVAEEMRDAFNSRTISEYLNAISSPKKVFLHVDELGKIYTSQHSPHHDLLDTMISTLGTIWDAGIMVLVTSLNQRLFAKPNLTDASAQIIEWVQISRLTQADVTKIMDSAGEASTWNDRVMKVLIQCNGHPRSIAWFLNCCLSKYKDMMNDMSISVDHISDEYSKLLAHRGALINDESRADLKVIPTMSILQLRTFIGSHQFPELKSIINMSHQFDWLHLRNSTCTGKE
ncbi:hypothetical protein PROFUN_15820, partial [Planoprotostelium fungivorum]